MVAVSKVGLLTNKLPHSSIVPAPAKKPRKGRRPVNERRRPRRRWLDDSVGFVKGRKPMDRRIAVILYVVAMVALIVSVDLLFFKDRFWERLLVNIGIALVFAALYVRFLARS